MEDFRRPSKAILVPLLLAIGVFACARKRPVERVYDTENNRWPKEVFLTDTPWLSKVTVTKTSDKGGLAFVGLQSGTYLGYFEFSRDKLSYYSALGLEAGNKATAKELVNSWDITHSDYYLAKSGGRVTNREMENPEINWYEKRYFKVDWAKANISEATTFPFELDNGCWSKKSSSLVEDSQEISEAHITFTVAVDYELRNECLTYERYATSDHTHTLHFKYSFMPLDEDSDYKPYVYTGENDPLMMKYGYFNTVVESKGGDQVYKNTFLMNRWHPEKTHAYYFAEDFPEEYKTIFSDPKTGIFAQTNAIFQKHGINTRFTIQDNDGTKKFGDIRYSFVKFVKELDRGAPFGYGPSDVNPQTGEIVSANLIMWTGYLENYLWRMNEEQKKASSRLADSSVLREIKTYLGNDESTWTVSAVNLAPNTDAGWLFRFLLPEFTYGSPGNGFAHLLPDNWFKSYPVEQVLKHMGRSPHPEIEMVMRSLKDTVEKTTQSAYQVSRDHRETTIYDIEQPLVDGRKMLLAGMSREDTLQRLVYRVAIHEMGHNLNLRHNFYGSVDAKNFRTAVTDADGVSRPQVTSSVMDYLALRDSIYFNNGWEPYDEAALAYAYSNGIKDLSDARNNTYLYCTDEHVAVNALCNRHDSGTTPSAIVKSLIERYEDTYWIRNFRADRPYWSTGGYDSAIFMTMWDLKKFLKMYEQTFSDNDVAAKMANNETYSSSELISLAATIRRDMKQAVTLAAAFMGAVIQQTLTDRPFTETYNKWSGALERKGIMADKMFAAMFLLGDDGFVYNPNLGATAVSYLPLLSDTNVGTVLSSIFDKNVMEPGHMYLGYNSFLRTIYAINAVNYLDVGGTQVAIDRLRLACYSVDSFQTKFGIPDVSVYDYNATVTPHELIAETIDKAVLNFTAPATSDPYFRTGTNRIGVIRLNGNFYVASEQKNPYSFSLVSRQLYNEILDAYYIYHSVTTGRVPECQ